MRDTRFDLVSAGGAAAEAAITLDLAWEGAVQAELGRAKIICTIRPASNSEAAMRDLMRLGTDVARLNFSHGTHHEHARNIARLRRAAKKEQRTISILQDLEGPKIRTGRLKSHSPLQLAAGSRVTLTPRQLPGTDEIISTNFLGLASEVGPGSTILLSDGLIELRVEAILGDEVECEVINGGALSEQQGINLPGTRTRAASLR